MITNRIAFIDIAKGLMLLQVMLTHTAAYPVAYPFDNMALALFFICAGFTSRTDFSLSRKIGKLLKPYLILNLLCICYMAIVSPSALTTEALAGVLYSRYMAVPGRTVLLPLCNGVLWFITALITAFAVYRLILIGKGVRVQSVLCLLSIAVAALLQRLPVLLPWSIDSAFYFAPLMWVGRRLHDYDLINRLTFWHIALLVIIYTFAFLLTGTTNYSTREFGDYFMLTIVCGVTGTVAFLWISRRLDSTRFSDIIVKFNSQALYLFGLQMVFIDFVARLCYKAGVSGYAVPLLQVVVACVGGYSVGILVEQRLPRALATLKRRVIRSHE